MKYLLDSNIIIFVLGGSGEHLRARMAEADEDDFVTSSIAYAEVAYGSAQGKPPSLAALQRFVRQVPVLDFDYKAALAYAALPFRRASFDGLIAAHALSHDLIVITDNIAHFDDVPGLRAENWAAGD